MYSYYVSLDLGQRQDYTAVAVIEEPVWVPQWATQHPAWAWELGIEEAGWISPAKIYSTYVKSARIASMRFRHPLGVPLNLRDLHRFPLGTPYPEIVESVRAMLDTEPLAGRDMALVVDATGVGAGVVDQFAVAGMQPIAVSIHGGDRVGSESVRHGHDVFWRYRVPKRDLVSAVQVLSQQRRLKTPRALEHADTLRQELQNFHVKIDPKTSHDSYSHWREGSHDDLVLATALAAWFRQFYCRHIDVAYSA